MVLLHNLGWGHGVEMFTEMERRRERTPTEERKAEGDHQLEKGRREREHSLEKEGKEREHQLEKGSREREHLTGERKE